MKGTEPLPEPLPEPPPEPPPGPTRDRAPRALVVTASNRASAGVYQDLGGPVLAEGLRAAGFDVDGPRVVPDGAPVEAALRQAVRERYDVVLTTGGTGISATDRTPEVTARVLDRQIPGIAELVRARGVAAGVTSAVLSRGLAGQASGTIIVNLPGSPAACRDAIVVLGEVLPHAVAQVRGSDHDTGPAQPGRVEQTIGGAD